MCVCVCVRPRKEDAIMWNAMYSHLVVKAEHLVDGHAENMFQIIDEFP